MWRALTFLNPLNRLAACRLLAAIIDPRWYRHPFRPERRSRLYARLGLTPENAAALVRGTPPGRNFYEARVAACLWYTVGAKPPDGPRSFPWRQFLAEPDPVRGLLRASRRVVDFVVEAWLAQLPPRHPELYSWPSRFFRDPDEAAVFLEHLTWHKEV